MDSYGCGYSPTHGMVEYWNNGIMGRESGKNPILLVIDSFGLIFPSFQAD